MRSPTRNKRGYDEMKAAVRIQEEDFFQDEEIRALQAGSKRIGGIATFLGCARDFSEGREVSEISFDAYGSMAVVEMNRLRDEAIASSACWKRASCTASARSRAAKTSCSSRPARNTAHLPWMPAAG